MILTTRAQTLRQTHMNTCPVELSDSQDDSSSTHSAFEVAHEEPFSDTPGQCIMDADEQSESTPDAYNKHETLDTSGYKRYATDYCHELWPSPRPVNFVKALIKSDHLRIKGRISHGKAIEILSSRANMDPEEFLKVNPIMYSMAFMPNQYKAAVLIGQSIQRLEDIIHRHQYLATLRKHG